MISSAGPGAKLRYDTIIKVLHGLGVKITVPPEGGTTNPSVEHYSRISEIIKHKKPGF